MSTAGYRVTRRRIWPSVGVLAGGLLSVAVLFSGRLGYSGPLPPGLPARFTMFGIPFQYHPDCFILLQHGRCLAPHGLAASLPQCPTLTYLYRHHYWPLQQIGAIPAMFGPAHPVYNILAAWSIAPPYGLYLVRAGSCYLPYRQAPNG